MPVERLPHEQNFVYNNPHQNVVFTGPVPANPNTTYGDEDYNPVHYEDYDEDCSNCDGAGTIVRDCDECGGTGEIEEDCGDCEGEGTVEAYY